MNTTTVVATGEETLSAEADPEPEVTSAEGALAELVRLLAAGYRDAPLFA
jgi:hypothetical protein